MKPSANQIKTLSHLLQSQAACLKELLKTLKQEHEVLSSGDVDTLLTTTEEKQQLLHKLELHMSGVTGFLCDEGLGTDMAAIPELLEQLPANSPLQKLWPALQQLSSRCQDQNEINGGIVTLNQRHTREALNILKGNQSAGDTYGKQGTTNSSASSGTLAKA